MKSRRLTTEAILLIAITRATSWHGSDPTSVSTALGNPETESLEFDVGDSLSILRL